MARGESAGPKYRILLYISLSANCDSLTNKGKVDLIAGPYLPITNVGLVA